MHIYLTSYSFILLYIMVSFFVDEYIDGPATFALRVKRLTAFFLPKALYTLAIACLAYLCLGSTSD